MDSLPRSHNATTSDTTPFIGVCRRTNCNGWRASFKGVHLGSNKDTFVCAFLYDHAVFRENKGGCTNFKYPNPAFPLSRKALTSLKNEETKAKPQTVAVGIRQLSPYKFNVTVSAKHAGTFPSLDEANIFSQMAQSQGITHAKELAKHIYAPKRRRTDPTNWLAPDLPDC